MLRSGCKVSLRILRFTPHMSFLSKKLSLDLMEILVKTILVEEILEDLYPRLVYKVCN